MQRRTFLRNAATISAITILKPGIAFSSKRNSAIQVGFIGCGNRGTEVISSMSKSTNINIISLADLFDDRLTEAQTKLSKLNAEKGFAQIDRANMFKGSRAYMQLLNKKDVQAVLIASPTAPYFLN